MISILDNVVPHEPRFFDTPLTKYFLTGSTGCVTLCEAVSEDLLRIKPEARYTVIQHPLYSHFGEKIERIEAEKRLGLKSNKRNILFFGLIRKYKGLDILLEAGFELRQPGCSACLAMNSDKVPGGKYALSTSNRNFEGRQGPGARTMLCGPVVAAAAAVNGVITNV